MKQPNVNPYVYQKIRSLANKGYITELVHEADEERPMREGGASVPNQRQHPRPKYGAGDTPGASGSTEEMINLLVCSRCF